MKLESQNYYEGVEEAVRAGVLAMVLASVAACGEGGNDPLDQPDYSFDANKPGASSVQLPCAPRYQATLPVQAIRGDVVLMVKRAHFGHRTTNYDVGYDLSPGDTAEVVYCTNFGDTTFELEVSPYGEPGTDGNRAALAFGPEQWADFVVSAGDGEEVFQSNGITLGFSGPEGVAEEFDLTLKPWQL